MKTNKLDLVKNNLFFVLCLVLVYTPFVTELCIMTARGLPTVHKFVFLGAELYCLLCSLRVRMEIKIRGK